MNQHSDANKSQKVQFDVMTFTRYHHLTDKATTLMKLEQATICPREISILCHMTKQMTNNIHKTYKFDIPQLKCHQDL